MARLIDDLAEAPLIPEFFIDRFVRSEAWSPWRRKDMPRPKAKLLNDTHYKILVGLSEGKTYDQMKQEGISADPSQMGAIIRGRLGALTNEHAVAVAVAQGIIPAPMPLFPPGRPFQVTSFFENHGKVLTKRQKQVLRRTANGMLDSEIAEEFGVGVETVRSQVKDLRKKYGARNKAHLVAIAIRLGHLG